MRLLPDVNVLIALFDDDHFFNAKARALFARPRLKIATCPLVENGVMRVLNARPPCVNWSLVNLR